MNNELLFAIDELIQPAVLRREYDDGPTRIVENLTGPTLLEELIDAIEPGTNVTTGGTGFGSRPPIDAAALDLWVEISCEVRCWADDLEIDRSRYAGVAELLRAVPAVSVRWDDDQSHSAATACRRWSRRIRAMLHDSRTWRGVRGVPCEGCGEAWIYEKRFEDGKEQTFREPALIAHLDDVGMIKYWLCRACEVMTWRDSEC